jgi:hypothetical protein
MIAIERQRQLAFISGFNTVINLALNLILIDDPISIVENRFFFEQIAFHPLISQRIASLFRATS